MSIDFSEFRELSRSLLAFQLFSLISVLGARN